MTSPRDLVVKRLTRRARQFPDLGLAALDTAALADHDPRDAALAQAIDHAVARRWLTLVAVIESRLDRPWDQLETAVQALLLAGAAQLLFFDRLPDHAVINEMVETTKRTRPRARGLVNAILRRIADLRVEIVDQHDCQRADEIALEDGRAWRLRDRVFDADPLRRLAQQTSHVDTLLSRWLELFGECATQDLAYHDLVHAPIIVANVSHADDDLQPHRVPGFHVFTGARDDLVALLERHESARVQDPGSAAAIVAAASLEPKLIVDACAGQGTKTRQLASQYPEALILATDIDPGRRAVLRETFTGHDRVHVVEPDGLLDVHGRVDLLVLDVPCSNTGVLARRVEARYRYERGWIEQLVQLQRQIIADHLALVEPEDGRLLYVTCSIEPDENERQAEWIAHWHQMKIVASQTRRPGGRPGDAPACYTDGGFHALLECGGR
jgi:16S rRNA (cytosine967-C5)-methyltransferase